jgi:hypothetical protein
VNFIRRELSWRNTGAADITGLTDGCDTAAITITTEHECNDIRWRESIVAHWQLSMPKARLHAMVMFQTCEVNMESRYISRYLAGFEPERLVKISGNLLLGDPLHAVKAPGKQPPPIKPPGPKRPPVKPPKPDEPPVQPPGPGKPPVEPPEPGRPPVKPPLDPPPIRASLRIGMG